MWPRTAAQRLAVEQRIVSGAVVDHAGARWRVERPLSADAVLLRNDAGEVVCASPAAISVPDELAVTAATRLVDELHHTDAEWFEAARRRDLLVALARLPRRSRGDVAQVAGELGLGQRRVFALLRQVQAGDGVEQFLPASGRPRAKRLDARVEAVITDAVALHYAKTNRPSLLSLCGNIAERCRIAGLQAPSYRAVQARVRATDQAWLTRKRHGPGAARAARLLTGAHPGAAAPWERVQIDSTPCDIRLVREDDRTVIGRPTATFAIDLFSRTVLGFSVSLEAASTITVATCLAQACLPKEDWLARRDLPGVHWPVWGRPGTLEYDQGPENEARGIQRGLRRHGIGSKVRARGQPEQHGTVERLIGTMMRMVHGLRGTTWSGITERGESRPDEQACLSLPELERILALAIDSYNHAAHEGIGERPLDRYLAYYRRTDLPDGERVPPRLPAGRLLLDFLPFERRALTRCGIRLFRVDYSSVDLLPLWRRDNQRRVERVVVYDPRSLARVWVLDETTGDYIAIPYRVPHPDMTLAQSGEARRRLQALKAQDRTERRLFDNLAEIRAIEASARTATTRRKAERTRQAGRALLTEGPMLGAASGPGGAVTPWEVSKDGREESGSPAQAAVTGRLTEGDATQLRPPRPGARTTPAWAGRAIAPFSDVERL